MTNAIEQHWNAHQYGENARFVSDLGQPVLDLLAPRAGERILDLGCGDGVLTAKIAALGCEVVGVDASDDMIAAARRLGLDAHVVDGEALDYDCEFDAVFSNAALHWMRQPLRVIEGVWRALRPGGRFVAECGAQGNVGAIVAALEGALQRRGIRPVNPWNFAARDAYAQMLESRGFRVDYIATLPRPTPLPGDVGAWLRTFAQSFLAAVPTDERDGFVAEVVEALRPVLCDANGRWTADYVRLRFVAVKTA